MSFEEFQKYANKSVDLGCGIYLVAEKEDIDTDKIEALKNELEQLNAVGYINFFGYSAEAFERYIVNDPFDSLEKINIIQLMELIFLRERLILIMSMRRNKGIRLNVS